MFWPALILGFTGSFHCMGMCSPLVMSVSNMSPGVMLNRFIYNAGRMVTYGILGGIVASIGLGLQFIKYQNAISILLGITLLTIGLTGTSVRKIPFFTNALGRLSLLLKRLFSKFIQRKSHLSVFTLGALNGVLPCGLSFLALTYCLTVKGPADGFMFMASFGLGTLPAMLGFTSAFYWVVKKFNVKAGTITTGMLVLSGLLLIARVFFIHLPHAQSLDQELIDIVLCK